MFLMYRPNSDNIGENRIFISFLGTQNPFLTHIKQYRWIRFLKKMLWGVFKRNTGYFSIFFQNNFSSIYVYPKYVEWFSR